MAISGGSRKSPRRAKHPEQPHGAKANAPGRRTRESAPPVQAADGGNLGAPPTLRRFRQFRWEHAEVEPYKVSAHRGGEFAGASRQVLIGRRGERVAFHLRYFELQAGGYTSLERHRHSHVVVGVRGRGLVRIGDENHTLGPLDAIYIGPQQAHQLRAAGRSKFGFFCIVDARRDKPRPVQIRGAATTRAEAKKTSRERK